MTRQLKFSGGMLRALMDERGLSAQRLAYELTGLREEKSATVSINSVNRWLNGGDPNVSNLRLLGDYFKVRWEV